MKRSCAVTWVLALFAIVLPMTAAAVAPPSHFGLAKGINCNTCHQPHRTLGASNDQGPIDRPSPAVFNNMCQSCHRTGDGFAKAKPMALVDTSAIFGDHSTQNFGNLRQTSHRWDGSDINPRAGAQPPILAAMTTNTNGVGNLRGRLGKELACARCHSPHLAGAPGAMLRAPIDQDQMCRDCHRSRDTQTHVTGTHPIGVNYDTAVGDFNRPNPLNANPANPTSDLSNRFTKTAPTRNIVCTTCHGVHYTDSRSSTFDGASTAKGRGNYTNLSTGDGYQLRTDRRGKAVPAGTTDNLNICSNCHSNKRSHNAKDQDVQCTDCHGAHVAYDADDPNNTKGTNVYLIRRDVKIGGDPLKPYISRGGTHSKIYFRYTGVSRMEYRNAAGTGVCQGCHAVPEAGGKYPAEHDSNLASDCKKCHFHSSAAGSFSGSCGQCHGMPPASATPGPGGLALPASGALDGTAGAHVKHVSGNLKMECNTCHNGYSQRVMPNTTIDIGFALNGVNIPGFPNVTSTKSKYNTTKALNTPYLGFTGNIGTGAQYTCSGIYCHGSTLTGGSNTTPSWVAGPGQAACGTCHGASTANPPTSWPTAGSHARHAGSGTGLLGLTCAACHGTHNENKHVNGDVSWNFAGLKGLYNTPSYKTPSGRFTSMSGSTGRIAPSTRYGTCLVYCHSNSGPNNTAITPTAVTWGGTALTCGSCHNNMATINSASPNGGHYKHASSANTNGPALDCSACHTGYTATSTNGTTHANQKVELDNVITGYSKTSPMTAGSGWGTCSTSRCHGSATGLVWGGTIYQTGGDHCTTCHSSTSGVNAGNPFYSTYYPGTPTKQTAKTDSKVGAHTYHVSNISLMSRNFVCTDCHGTVTMNSATHMNGSTTFSWSAFTIFSSQLTKKVLPSYNGANCTNYCHGSKLPYGDTTGTFRNPSWSTPFMPTTFNAANPAPACNGCHGFPPSLASGHPSVPATLAVCKTCHANVNSAATSYADVFVDKTQHIDGVLQGGGCNGCHGYPPSRKGFTGSAGNWIDARIENYTSGGGSHTVAAHVTPGATQDQGWVNCSKCHNENDHATTPLVFLPSTNIKVNIDQKFRFSADRPAKYEMNRNDGSSHAASNCSNISCHYQKTPKW